MKKKILKVLLIIAVIGVIACGAYFVLRLCGFTTADDFIRLRDNIGDNIWFWLIIVGLQAFQVVFIPISNQIISVPLALIFPTEELWKIFLSSWFGIFAGTIALYFIGRYGGEKLLTWVLGDKKKVDKCVNFLNKGRSFYIAGMLIPFIPDDVLTTLAGTSKYNFMYVLSVSFITRGICVASSVWGFGLLTQFWWGWLILILGGMCLGIGTFILFKVQNKKES